MAEGDIDRVRRNPNTRETSVHLEFCQSWLERLRSSRQMK
jgi:hypothetical protein